MPGDIIEVSPARPSETQTWTGGDPDCDHNAVDQVSRHAVCRDCCATTVETVNMPDNLLTEKPGPYLGEMERV